MLLFGADTRTVKAYRRGTHRSQAPEATIARIQPLMPVFGITRVANLTGLDRIGLPVVMVCRPNARSSAVFHGKGVDLAAAKASGLMEAVETWHAEHVQLPLCFGSVGELARSRKLVEIGELPRLPATRIDNDLALLWTEGQDLLSGERVWLPYEIVHANSAANGLPASGCFSASTNGLASGNNLLEAASHALCEVIERDATSLWHRSHPGLQAQTALDLATVRDATCRAVLDRLADACLDVGVWDITSDVGVPAFVCLAADASGEIGHTGFGAGCHPASEIALARALTEAAQVRTTYIVGSREDIEHADYSAATLARRGQHVRSLLQRAARRRDFTAVGRFEFESFEGEVAWLLECLKRAGVRQVVAVDLSRPEYGIAVVRVVVPGLEGSDHHSGYSPGRRARAISERPA